MLRMRHLNLLVLLLLYTYAGAQSWSLVADKKAALDELNTARKMAGLNPVSLSDTLSDWCTAHARYLALNKGREETAGLKAHEEPEGLEGYSRNGREAGSKAVIHYIKPSAAVSGWIATFYHRVPLLQPNLTEIGIGYYEEKGYEVTLLYCIPKNMLTSKAEPVVYPGDKQQNVPLVMGWEYPYPKTEPKEKKDPGFPITVSFNLQQAITKASFELRDAGNTIIPCYISSSKKPATNFSQWNTICGIPKSPLQRDHTYTVSVKCLVNGKPFAKKYSFRT